MKEKMTKRYNRIKKEFEEYMTDYHAMNKNMNGKAKKSSDKFAKKGFEYDLSCFEDKFENVSDMSEKLEELKALFKKTQELWVE